MGFNGDLMVIFHGIYGGLMESNGIYPAWLWLLQFAMEAMVHRNRWFTY